MKSLVKVFCVKMERWGDPNLHSYVSILTKNYELASLLGFAHKQYRGGKYEANILEFELKDQEEYFVIEQFDEDRTFSIVSVLDNPSDAKEILDTKPRELQECKKMISQSAMSRESLLECHHRLDSFSTKEKTVLRDLYEDYIRKYYFY